MTDQPKPHPLAGRNCGNCAFTAKTRVQSTDISATLVCIEGPPNMIPQFTPQGVTYQIMQPPVNETVCCWRHKFPREVEAKNPPENSAPQGPVIASN